MKYCEYCGNQIEDDALICMQCGMPLEEKKNINEDSGSIGWGILGFCIPIVGLILFLVWSDTKPKSAKVSILGAAISFGLALILPFILIAIGMGILATV